MGNAAIFTASRLNLVEMVAGRQPHFLQFSSARRGGWEPEVLHGHWGRRSGLGLVPRSGSMKGLSSGLNW